MKKHCIAIASALLIAFVLIACGGKPPVEEKEIIRPVRYEEVRLTVEHLQRAFSGVTQAGTQTRLSFRLAGIVKQVNVKVGDLVKKGAPIATLDDADEQLRLAENRADVNNAKVQMDIAGSNLKRIRELYENNNISLNEYENAKNSHSSAKAAHEIALKRLDLQKRQLSYSRLAAPHGGVVAAVSVEKNENISAGQVVVELSSGKDIEVVAGLPESYVAQVQRGGSAQVTFSSIIDRTFEGIISEISFVASDASTYPVTVKLSGVHPGLRPGMPARVSFDLEREKLRNRIFVPPNSVGQDVDGHFVFLVHPAPEKGLAKTVKKPITVGPLTDEGIEVLEGIAAGDRIVTAGISKITHDMTVRFIQ